MTKIEGRSQPSELVLYMNVSLHLCFSVYYFIFKGSKFTMHFHVTVFVLNIHL